MSFIDQVALKALCERYPIPSGVQYSYGTSGFRLQGNLLAPALARVALLLPFRGAYWSKQAGKEGNGRAIHLGLMITASHNPAADNGAKLIDFEGSMLDVHWEPVATELANSQGADELSSILRRLTEAHGLWSGGLPPADSEPVCVVHVGRDTRPSGVEILRSCLETFSIFPAQLVRVMDQGVLSTPALHCVVYDSCRLNISSRRVQLDIEHYLSSRLQAFNDLYLSVSEIVAPLIVKKKRLVVDGANGVGAVILRQLIAHPLAKEVLNKYFDVVVVNGNVAEVQLLNFECGADHVQKTRVAPHQFAPFYEAEENDAKLVSFYSLDGDADRVVAFSSNTRQLLDGDRFSVMLANLVRRILDADISEEEAQQVVVGVVQTAYANGSSTHYIESILRLRTMCTATGVKYLHPVAHTMDVGIYFEANGHGTVLINQPKLLQKSSKLRALSRITSQACGDAIGDLLACEIALLWLGFDSEDWVQLFHDLPSIQSKIHIASPRVIQTEPNERRATHPVGLQPAIDEAVGATKDRRARAFVRPSGTEPLVRVYVEASSVEVTQELEKSVRDLVLTYCA